jgi:hypothetical protein
MTSTQTDRLLIARVSTSDFAAPSATLAQRQSIAAARPELADDMRVGTLRVYSTEADLGRDDSSMATIEWQEHMTVTTVVTVRLADVPAEIAALQRAGVIPAHIALTTLGPTSAIADL